MSGPTPCPETSTLRGLLEDGLATVEMEGVLSHLGECPACQQTLDQLAAGDPALQQCVCAAAREKIPAPDSAFWPALRELERIGERPSTPNRTPSPDPAATTFLDPTDEPDRLGRLGRFEIVRVIGRGGMGMVLHAFDPRLGRDVALKVLDPQLAQDETARQRFCREARAAAKVSDDHIVAVHEVDEEGKGLPYLVMQLVEGETLEDRLLREKQLPMDEIVRIGMQIAAGLAAAHEKGLIHRDVKPGNVLIERGTERVKLTDFGLARAAEDLRLTRSGLVAGTPLYMAPEQARGEDLDHRADLFSFGVVLYEMAAGVPPFVGKTPLVVLKRLADEPHKPVRELNPAVPDWLAELIDKLLAKAPAQRFQSAREVAQLLEQHHLHMRTTTGDHLICPRAKVRRKIIQLTAVAALSGVVLTLVVLGTFKLARSWLPSLTPSPKPWATLNDNRGAIWSVAPSPDGQLLAVGTESQGVKFWDPRTDRVEATLPHAGPVWGVSFSPDGKLVAVASEEGRVKVYEWPGRNVLHELVHSTAVRAVAFSRDSSKLVTSGRTGKVSVWDVVKGERLIQVDANTFVWSVAFSPDGENFASAGADGQAILWETKTGQERLKMEKQNGSLQTLAFSPDGKILATGGWDGIVRLWDTGTGKLLGDLRGSMKDVWSLSFCPSGKVLATGSDDGSVRLWNVPSRQERLVLTGHSRSVFAVAITRDGKNLASGSRDGTALMWTIPPLCYE